MLVYVYTLVKKWWFYEDDDISTVIKSINDDDMELVQFNETGIIPSFSIINLYEFKPMKEEEYKRYFSVNMVNMKADMTNGKLR